MTACSELYVFSDLMVEKHKDMGRPFCSGVINHEDAILSDWGACHSNCHGFRDRCMRYC